MSRLKTIVIRLAKQNPEFGRALLQELRTAASTSEGATCDMVEGCKAPVVYIDDSGFVYCDKHGQQRKQGGRRVRKLSPGEIKKLQRGETVPKYAVQEED